MAGRIAEEFDKLKRSFRLRRVRLVVAPEMVRAVVGGRTFVAYYDPPEKTIYLPHTRRTAANLLALLHEFCHAIQDSQRRLPLSDDFDANWPLEVEAEKFAWQAYNERYANRYGARVWEDGRWEELRVHYKRFYK